MVSKTRLALIPRVPGSSGRGAQDWLRNLAAWTSAGILLMGASQMAQGQTAEAPMAQGQMAQSPMAQGKIGVTEDLTTAMEIPSVIAMAASPLHLYVLSESDGLIVFRTSGDSLNWLYSSTGMQRRGQRLQVDARFAYLTGQEPLLTVIEPTSLLGVYSSTSLPAAPRSAARTGTLLWIAMGSGGLGAISLESPESVDAGIRQPFAGRLAGHRVLDVVSDPSSTLFILTETSSDQRRWVHTAKLMDPDSAAYMGAAAIGLTMTRLHLVAGRLFGSTDRGDLHRVMEDGEPLYVAGFGSALDVVHPTLASDGSIIVRTRSGKLWIGSEMDGFELVRSASEAGNHIGVSHHGIRISQHGRISRLVISPGSNADSSPGDSTAGVEGEVVGAGGAGVEAGGGAGVADGRTVAGMPSAQDPKRPDAVRRQGTRDRFRLVRISDQMVPAQRPLILPIGLEGDPDHGPVDLALISGAADAVIRGRSFHWRPSSGQIGEHMFTVLATSSTGERDTVSFRVKVNQFNLPPRFAPIRPITLPAGMPFQTFFTAIDPDGMSRDLIRYLGVDLPSGSALNEVTGEFIWTPAENQVGAHSFRIIATDVWGSPFPQDVAIRVIERE